jgi:hypothetical protein
MNDKLFLTYGNAKERMTAVQEMERGFADYYQRSSRTALTAENVERAMANTLFKDVLPGVSVRDGFSRGDREWFRPYEAEPHLFRNMIYKCEHNYRRHPVVFNTINMMTELVCQGIKVVCKNKKWEKVYKFWAEKVDMEDRSRHFVNDFYTGGQTCPYRTTAKLKAKDLRKLFELKNRKRKPSKMKAAADITEIPPDVELESKEIPWEYTFIPPYIIEPVGKQYEFFIGKPQWGIRLSPKLQKYVTVNVDQKQKEIGPDMPPFMKKFVDSGLNFMQLDKTKFQVFHYNKKDCQLYAYPMIYPILEDIAVYEKMRLADISALDGATSHIRVWKIGDLEKGILPGPGLIAAFNDQLMNQVPNGTTDIITHPAIQLEESKTDLHLFLGSAKYEECKSNIAAGLGLPQAVTGGGGGMTNNFVSMKIIMERLEYARSVLVKFWKKELKLFQDALGIPADPELDFAFISLSDESAEKALWIHLLDRDVISLETMRERMGLNPDVEQYRIQREYRQRKSNKTPQKTSPYHDAQPELSLEKIALQTEVVTPTEVGLELDERKKGEKTSLDLQLEQLKQKPKPTTTGGPKGTPGQGRPKNSKDSQKRKQKVVKPRTTFKGSEFVNTMFWAKAAAEQIDEYMLEPFLKKNGVDSYDRLPAKSAYDYETALFGALCAFEPGEEVTRDSLLSKFSGEIDMAAIETFENFCDGALPAREEIRHFNGLVYSNIFA